MACRLLGAFTEKMEGAQNRQLQHQKPTFSGLKGQQKRSGVAGASAGPCFSMLKQNIAGESQAGRGPQKNAGGFTRVAGRSQRVGGSQDGLASGRVATKNQKCSNFGDIFRVQQGGFSRFFRIFQCFLLLFNVFQGVSGFVTLDSDEGPPPRPFHSLVLVKGGFVFFNFKGKIVF